VLTGVSFGGTGWFPLRNFNDANFHSVRICLSGGGYAPDDTVGKGAPVKFRLGPYQQPAACPNSTIANFAFDHFNIVSANAGECGTALGEGVNFDAESAGGWTFTTSGGSAGAFINGLGVGGTKAARINMAANCDTAQMETFFNVPDVANPALDFFVGFNAGANGIIRMGANLINVTPPASGTSSTIHMCLPPSLRGQTTNITYTVNFVNGIACGTAENHQIFSDNVRVVDDPACASAGNYANAGFEEGNVPFGAFGSKSTSTADAVIRSVPGEAHGGTKYLSLESNGRCSNSGYNMLPIVPPSSGANGPALKFFAKVGANANATTTVRAFNVPTQTLTEGVGYVQYIVCLNPLFVGHPQLVTIAHDGGSGLCDNSNYVRQDALIDDIEVTTDASCPAQ
jgi:hypothetical protein